MEVKIKNQNELIDADWTIEDGIMVVSPKDVEFEPKDVEFEPKDGDVIYVRAEFEWVAIYKENNSDDIYDYVCVRVLGDVLVDGSCSLCYKGDIREIRHATKEEKQKLFQALADNGLEWDAEKKQLVKLKWKPKYKEFYLRIIFGHAVIIPYRTYWMDDICDKAYYQKGWCFKTKEECQEFCNRLNKAIENIKP